MCAFRDERAILTRDGYAYDAEFLRSFFSAGLLRIHVGNKRHFPTLRKPVRPVLLRERMISVCPGVRCVESMKRFANH